MFMRIVTLFFAFGGLVLAVFSYVYPTWSEFKHNGVSGSLGVHQMCAHEKDGEWDCRDIQHKGHYKLYSK